jgi:hypothetical protein
MKRHWRNSYRNIICPSSYSRIDRPVLSCPVLSYPALLSPILVMHCPFLSSTVPSSPMLPHLIPSFSRSISLCPVSHSPALSSPSLALSLFHPVLSGTAMSCPIALCIALRVRQLVPLEVRPSVCLSVWTTVTFLSVCLSASQWLWLWLSVSLRSTGMRHIVFHRRKGGRTD